MIDAPAPTVLARLALLDAEEARITAAQAEVTRLQALLADAQQEVLAAIGGSYRVSWRREARRGLVAVQALLDTGARAVTVSSHSKFPMPGALVRVTAARATVLTEMGEMVFDLKTNNASYGRPGSGRGDASPFWINVSDVA